MASDRQRLEEGSTDDYGSQLNTSPTDELAAFSALARSVEELKIIRILQRFIGPVLVPLLKPLIYQIVTEQIGSATQELLANMKQNPGIGATNSVPKRRLTLQIRNRISLPVHTGRPIVGENGTAIEIALVDAFTGQVITTGIESTAKLQIVGFRVGDDDIDSWTLEDFQERVISEKKGKRILQGNTYLQLKDGVCCVCKINFTHNSENTKNGMYRLGVGVVDAGLMNTVEVARTEAFLVKDGRTTYSEKHTYPRLSDKVCHLLQISYKGTRHRRLEDAGVLTVKDFLTLFYTDPKRLLHILDLKATKTWNNIVDNAQASNGMFLYLDPSNQGKTGVVLNAKLQLKGLIEEPHEYVPVDQLSAKQKEENEDLVKLASQHFEMLRSFEDETSLKEYLISCTSLQNDNQSLVTSNIIDGPSDSLNETPLMTQTTPTVTSQYDRGKGILNYDYEMTYPMNMPYLESSIGTATYQHAHYPTEPGTSYEDVESHGHTCEHMNNFTVFGQSESDYCWIIDPESNLLNYDDSMNFDSEVMMVAAQTVSIQFPRARTRWTKVSKLIRRNSVRERIGLPEGIQPLKKQRCC